MLFLVLILSWRIDLVGLKNDLGVVMDALKDASTQKSMTELRERLYKARVGLTKADATYTKKKAKFMAPLNKVRQALKQAQGKSGADILVVFKKIEEAQKAILDAKALITKS